MKLGRMHLVDDCDKPQPAPAGPLDTRLGGFAGAVWALFQHFQAGARTPARKHMRVVETLTLAPRKQLFLVHCDGQRFLVGTGAEGIQTITPVSVKKPVAEPAVTLAGRQEEEQC